MTPRSRSAFPALRSAASRRFPSPARLIALGLTVAIVLALGLSPVVPGIMAPGAVAQETPATTEPSTVDPASTDAVPSQPLAPDDSADTTREPERDVESDAGSNDPVLDDDAREQDAPQNEAPAVDGPAEDAPADEAPASEAPAGQAPDGEAPQPDAPAPDVTTAADTEITVALVGSALVGTRGGETIWRIPLRSEGGPTAGPVQEGGTAFVTHGLYLLTIDGSNGTVVRREALPAPAVGLATGEDGALVVTVAHGAPAGEATIAAPDGVPVGPVRFGTDTDALHGLARAARATPDPIVAAGHDPTDPWLALQAARMADLDAGRTDWLDLARDAGRTLPFFEQLALADAMLTLDAGDHAAALYEGAIADFAARGYDPRLATDEALRSAYGFPESGLRAALTSGDLERALTLAPYAWRLAAEEAPDSVAVLHELADALRDTDADALPASADDASPRELSRLWRERARALDRSGLDAWVDALALRLGALGWWGVAALLGAFVLLWWVLLAKVWKAQSLARRQLKERDQAPPQVTRLWVPRHASTTEKLALLALMVLAGLQAALAGWHENVQDPATALRSGTLASAEAVAALDDLPDTPRTRWARGVSLAQRGDLDAARAAWTEAGELAPALTNRAVAEGGDEALFDAALAADPREPVARYRTGRAGDPSPFHAATVPDAALWAVPSPMDLRLASAGAWSAALATALTEPWTALGDARPDAVPSWVAWVLAIGYGLLAIALAVFLVIPRPRVSRDAPRTFAYQLGAIVIPGSGHADELWGLLLLVPWSLIGVDALLVATGGSSPLGLSTAAHAWILGAAWAINAVGFSVEFASYRHRMRLLRERKPELARSYGLPPAPRPEA